MERCDVSRRAPTFGSAFGSAFALAIPAVAFTLLSALPVLTLVSSTLYEGGSRRLPQAPQATGGRRALRARRADRVTGVAIAGTSQTDGTQ